MALFSCPYSGAIVEVRPRDSLSVETKNGKILTINFNTVEMLMKRGIRMAAKLPIPVTSVVQLFQEAFDAHPYNIEECEKVAQHLRMYGPAMFIRRQFITGVMSRQTGGHYAMCHSRDETYLSDENQYMVSGHIVCEDVYENAVRCESCGDHFYHDDTVEANDERYCADCYTDLGFWHCGECGCDHSREDECPEGNEPGSGGRTIHGYTTDVTQHLESFRKHPTDAVRNKLFFGVELEVMPREDVRSNDAAKAAKKAMREYALLKSDASLDHGGFEIVTVPATLAFHKQVLWEEFFKGAHEKVKSWNTECCGLHIHFSRDALSPMQLGKFLMFMHEESNAHFLTRIAGREVSRSAHYCRTRKKKLAARKTEISKGEYRYTLVTTDSPQIAHNANGYTIHSMNEHYEAAGISNHTKGRTVEVRIFKGNASKFGVFRALDFVAALVEYCSVGAAGSLSYRDFVKWFSQAQNRGLYPDLWKHLIKLRFLKTKHKFRRKVEGGLIEVRPVDELPDLHQQLQMPEVELDEALI